MRDGPPILPESFLVGPWNLLPKLGLGSKRRRFERRAARYVLGGFRLTTTRNVPTGSARRKPRPARRSRARFSVGFLLLSRRFGAGDRRNDTCPPALRLNCPSRHSRAPGSDR